MPKKDTNSEVQTKKLRQKKVETEPVPTPVPVEKKTRAKKAEPVEKTVTEPTVTEATETTKTRVVPTRESVQKEFEDLIASVDEEINKLRDSTNKSKGVKFLRSVNKRLKIIENHSFRVSKQRQKTKRNNANSGFLKPVPISKELAKFTGWDPKDKHSRVDVTKFVCKYIKDRNLQDPEDKRKIRVETDKNLKTLLQYDSAKDSAPLTYYSLQRYLKNHFVSEPKA